MEGTLHGRGLKSQVSKKHGVLRGATNEGPRRKGVCRVIWDRINTRRVLKNIIVFNNFSGKNTVVPPGSPGIVNPTKIS
jgi:hypothetical protein